ncbi:MAG: ECF transporter S component [Lachnospiraceae bacterium]|nr:ECF transporter S component [Lachnospiraceae bacterium]
MKNTNVNVARLATMALLTAAIFVLQFVTVPLGAITVSLSMVPVAIAAITMGSVYGLIGGAIWGLASIIKALLGSSGLTSTLFTISPLLTIVLCFVPRMLDGFLLGFIYKGARKFTNVLVAGTITGFFSAFLNTVFFMSTIVLLFGNTEYVQNMMAGKNVIVFICSIIAGNAIFEMLVASIVTGPVAQALKSAKLIPTSDNTVSI